LSGAIVIFLWFKALVRTGQLSGTGALSVDGLGGIAIFLVVILSRQGESDSRSNGGSKDQSETETNPQLPADGT